MKTKILLVVVYILTAIAFVTAQQVDRSKYPSAGEIPSVTLPTIETFSLRNGLPVYYLNKSEVPVLQLHLMIKTGSAHEPEKQTGLAAITASMLKEGAGKRSALELADEIDYLGITLNAYAGTEQSGITLFTPLSRLDPALELMRDILLYPQFSEQELERKRKSLLVNLAQAHDEASILAATAFSRLVYGSSHPYGRMKNGTETTIRTFKTDDLKNFHRQHYVPENAYLIAVGAADKSELQEKLERLFAEWKSGTSNSVKVSDPKPVKGRTVYIVDKPGAAQSEIQIGCVGVNRNTPDYYAITVMNTILGASFTSRLNQNLRETHGYTYGAGSRFRMFRSKGAFVAASAVQTEVTDKALMEFMKELTDISRTVTDEEVAKARNYVALGYPGDFQSVQSVASLMDEKIFYDLPDAYFNDYVKNILAVTREDVLRVAKAYINPDNLVIVIAGDRSKIEPGIKKMKLGKIVNLTHEDVLGKVPKL